MSSDPNNPVVKDPFLCNIVPSPPEPEPPRQSGRIRQMFAIVLSLCLGLFLMDAIASFLDDSLVFFFNLHAISILREIISVLATLMAVGIYLLIGLTPAVPKRLFLPIPLFCLVATLAVFPFAIYCYDRLPLVVWVISGCQVLLGLWLYCQAQNGLKFHWPPVSEGHLGIKNFSWGNSIRFALVNFFVLLPAVFIYICVGSALAVDHFSGGFMALRPSGFTVQVRKYVRNDGKMIELFPMSHVADESFYDQVSQTFPTNSIILMEGVTDEHNLLTNKISYARMAKSLGLAEQHEKFAPSRGVKVRADVDVDQFSPETIELLNLVMLIHAQGVTPENVRKLMQYSPTPQIEAQLFDDILRKRNEHLLKEIQSHLPQTRNLMVPWGVAHMPGIARGIEKAGFHLDETEDYTIIRFFHSRK